MPLEDNGSTFQTKLDGRDKNRFNKVNTVDKRLSNPLGTTRQPHFSYKFYHKIIICAI